ncbi:MAG TPA: glycoside hydrolase family 2 protein, partial [Polyangiaceae bacterium]
APMVGVIAKHRAAVGNIEHADSVPADLLGHCRKAWDDALDLGSTDWFHTPTTTFADYSALSTMAAATVQAKIAPGAGAGKEQVTLTNSGTSIAFFTRLKLTAGKGGPMVLPVLWQDNYVSLMPGESRTLEVSYAPADLGAATPAVDVSGWNVAAQTIGG